MNHRWLTPLLPLVILFALPAANSSAQERSDVLRTVERIRNEERRQGGVRRQLGDAVRRIDRLLVDLQSNQLTEQGGGQIIGQVSTDLAKVGNARVPAARGHLQHARVNIDDAYQHLDKAEAEIHAIVADLDRLLKSTEAALAGDLLLKKLREIIKTEDFLRRETAKWGKILLTTPEMADVDKHRVARAQQDVSRMVEEFTRLLSDAIAGTTDGNVKLTLSKAKNVMRESQLDALLESAVEAILSEDAFAAVEHQDKAIEALKQIERILSADQQEITTKLYVIEELKRILKEQIDLKTQTAQMQAADKQQHSTAQAEQLQLGKDLRKAMSGEPPHESAKAAEEAMQLAAEHLDQGSIQPAADNQQTAINELEKLIAELDAEMEAAAEAAAKLAAENADTGDQMAGDAYGDMYGDSSYYPQSDMYNDMFGDMFGGMDGMNGMGPGPGSGSGMQPGMGGMSGSGPPGELPDNPAIGAGGSSSTMVQGKRVDRTRMSINSLKRRQRAEAIQKYIQQFPPEFRKQVADYYEVLAE